MRRMRNPVVIALMLATALIFAGCSDGFSADSSVTVISREEGSGTRGAFEELFGIERTADSADIIPSTGAVLTSVQGDVSAIGYISLGSLNTTVKALEIDGAKATVENVKNGSYRVSRPFNIATKGEADGVVKDFIDFILSTEGQQIIEDENYIPSVDDPEPYAGTKVSGTVKISGSSSVTPVMEKLKEAYEKINENADIVINMTDSSTGISDVIEGVSDIGMASRELKDSEKTSGAVPTVIAIDGIAVIVNLENTVTGLTSEQVKKIYEGGVEKWSDIIG